ncbi:hypothetical protein [Mucilaginibacter puniceus]
MNIQNYYFLFIFRQIIPCAFIPNVSNNKFRNLLKKLSYICLSTLFLKLTQITCTEPSINIIRLDRVVFILEISISVLTAHLLLSTIAVRIQIRTTCWKPLTIHPSKDGKTVRSTFV